MQEVAGHGTEELNLEGKVVVPALDFWWTSGLAEASTSKLILFPI
jgi:hypothetical protein